jgi:integrase/recombinase XerD
MTDYLRLMKQAMDLRGLRPGTQERYLSQLQFFMAYYQQPPETMEETHVREYLHHLIITKNASRSTVNIAYNALKFFFKYSLRRAFVMEHIPRAKKEKRLPVVLSQQEVRRILAATTNLKHRAILMTIYGAGLRVSEAARLKIANIDSNTMQIHVQLGKGNVDRYTILSQTNLDILRQYWATYRPKLWLFPGASSDKPISSASIQQLFYRVKKKAGISKPASVHSLRHSFATHLLEAGTHLLSIQKFLGHSRITTTCRYLHLMPASIMKVKSPLDLLDDYYE